MADLQVLDAETAGRSSGSATRSSPARLACARRSTSTRCWRGWTTGTRAAALAAFASLAERRVGEHVGTPEFFWVRALAIEAFYSDFVAPGVDATGAWAEIDFNTPLATRLAKDWSYLGIG